MSDNNANLLNTANYQVELLDEVTKQHAQCYLHETEDSRAKSINEIRKWLISNKQLQNCLLVDDATIVSFLRCCKYDIDRVKVKLRNYFVLRTECPQWFLRRDPTLPTIQELVRLGLFLPLSQYNDNKMVVIVRAGAHNPTIHTQHDVLKAAFMVLDVAAREFVKSQVYGVIAIIDLHGISYAHARQLTLTIIKNIVLAWQNYHCRPQRLEFVNAPFYVNVILKIFKSFMNAKLKNRTSVHFGGLGSLHQIVDKDILPEEYGGKTGNLRDIANFWADKIIKYKSWYEIDENFKADLN